MFLRLIQRLAVVNRNNAKNTKVSQFGKRRFMLCSLYAIIFVPVEDFKELSLFPIMSIEFGGKTNKQVCVNFVT